MPPFTLSSDKFGNFSRKNLYPFFSFLANCLKSPSLMCSGGSMIFSISTNGTASMFSFPGTILFRFGHVFVQ